jgi:hypothetical protein
MWSNLLLETGVSGWVTRRGVNSGRLFRASSDSGIEQDAAVVEDGGDFEFAAELSDD